MWPSPLLLLSLVAGPGSAAKVPADAVLLSEVRSLTLRGHGALTAHRRVPAVPQLRCISAPAVCALAPLDLMRCENHGPAYGREDVQWSCTATVPASVRLGATDVVCEGYADRNDPYVLRGSCAVEYRLALTESGERLHPGLVADPASPSSFFSPSLSSSWFTWALLGTALAYIVWNLYFNNHNNRQPALRQPAQHNYFGGGHDDNDPPPPYSGPRPSKPSQPWQQRQQQQWRPGFWSGALGGAAAGYAAANARTRWGDAGPSRPRPQSSANLASTPSSSSSPPTYASTGFGSTSRR